MTDTMVEQEPTAVGLAAQRQAALEKRKESLTHILRKLAGRHPLGALGVLGIVFLVLLATLAPLIAPYHPESQDWTRLLPPSRQHIMGTDSLGRDVFSRVVFASRISLTVGVAAVVVAGIAGVPIGVFAGYLGDTFDMVVMRFIDIMLAFPALVLAVVLAGVLGASNRNAAIAIAIVYAPRFTRVARSSVLCVVEEDYILAARALGVPPKRILARHILPNILAPLFVLTTLQISTAIIFEASLSFLGLGTQPPDPSWGIMLSRGRQYMEQAPGLAVFPGMAIAIAVLSFNFVGDALRDALDPRLRGTGQV
jgi:ABC-type dipeptide/oligopeptide/nickel transport system permease subunit